ncbi:hypothetical protein J6590_097504 [Homalodisca vitripennis]|nr:hypothetical protein J6590_097504 [Homalodisca vitripennis]
MVPRNVPLELPRFSNNDSAFGHESCSRKNLGFLRPITDLGDNNGISGFKCTVASQMKQRGRGLCVIPSDSAGIARLLHSSSTVSSPAFGKRPFVASRPEQRLQLITCFPINGVSEREDKFTSRQPERATGQLVTPQKTSERSLLPCLN